jgi:dUTP pyrophosphatase
MQRQVVEVKFTKLHPDASELTQGSAHASGWDLRALETMTVQTGQSTRIPTGIAIAIPVGYEGQVRARSSLGAKGLIMPNGVGTIDADYRGELQVLVAWIGAEESFTIEAGERIAQLIIAPIPSVRFIEVRGSELGETERGSEGFGSTGRF